MSRQLLLRIIATIIAGLAIKGCESVEPGDPYDFESASLYGMVYDHSNQPVSGASVQIDGQPGPTTDLAGRFVLTDVTRGSHEAIVEKSRYETLRITFEFLNMTQVLYARVWSLGDLVDEAMVLTESGEIGAATAIVERAAALDPDGAAVGFLRSVLVFKQKGAEPAFDILVPLSLRYPEVAYIHLFAADLCEFELDLPNAAALYLQRFLAVAYDEGASRRLHQLQSAESD